MRGLVVAAEIALSLVLLAGAGLFARSLMRLLDVDPGFQANGVLTLRVALPEQKYRKDEDRLVFFAEALRRLRAIPGVVSVGAVNVLPLSGSNNSGTTTVDTTAVPPDQRAPEADWRPVLPGYFETMRVRLVAGRFFDDHDTAASAPVAIVDETFARTFWPNGDALGKRVKLGDTQSPGPWRTIVGIVGHVRYRTLEAASRVEIYWPQLQRPWPAQSFVVRTTLDPAGLKAAAERELQAIDPDQPVYAVRTMTELMTQSTARRRLATLLIGLFAVAALLLAAVGVYGLTATSVAERRQEIGIRMALGAKPAQVVRATVLESLTHAAIGVAAGLAGAAVLARIVASMLFETNAADPLTFGSVAAILIVAGIAASYAPARRATRIEPAVTLRAE
jgi:putative ABC transport system permease protein